jgi:hypothetical protein
MIRFIAVVTLLAVLPASANAQIRRRVEVGVGAGFAGGLALGERDAALVSNNTAGSPFRLFSSDTRIDGAPRLEVRLGYRLSSRLTIEGALTVARPRLTSSLTNDVENAVAVDASSTLTEYIVDGGASWRLSTNTRRRWTPFVSGGAGVARHVHEGQTLIESGVDAYAGGGLSYAFGRRTGLRVDGRMHVLNGGIAVGQGASPRGVLSGSFFVAF